MPKFLLDSNVLISYLRGEDRGWQVVSSRGGEGELCCSAISVLEVEAGIKRGEEEAAGGFFSELELYDVDKETAALAGRYSRQFRSRGITLDVPDLIIAATAVIHGLTLVTFNPKHYPMEVPIWPEASSDPHSGRSPDFGEGRDRDPDSG